MHNPKCWFRLFYGNFFKPRTSKTYAVHEHVDPHEVQSISAFGSLKSQADKCSIVCQHTWMNYKRSPLKPLGSFSVKNLLSNK